MNILLVLKHSKVTAPIYYVIRYLYRSCRVFTTAVRSIFYCRKWQKQARLVSQKDNIRVAFMLYDVAFWKSEALFTAMEKHPRFTPCMWIIPPLAQNGSDEAIFRFENCRKYAQSRGMRHYVTQRDELQLFLNQFSPDYLFLVHPYEYQVPFAISDLGDVIPCYIQYGYSNMDSPMAYNGHLQQLLHRMYVESEHFAELVSTYMINKGRNVRATGLPMADSLLTPCSHPAWPASADFLKKIIYAPHWSITGNSEDPVADYSTFLELGEAILELAQKYCDRIAFSFKPHPLIIHHLNKHPEWGESRVKEYFKAWDTLPNGQFVQGGYTALFQQSDAIIHDCCSFIHEYLLMNKPCMYLSKESKGVPFNETTQQALACYQKGYNINDVERFIIAVLNGEDPQKAQRSDFVHSQLILHNRTASDNIINDILRHCVRKVA